MLVLSRKIGETLHIGENVVIEIRRVAGRRVTIAVDAPRELRILRGEIFEAATEFEKPVGSTHPVVAPISAPTAGEALPAKSIAEGNQTESYLNLTPTS